MSDPVIPPSTSPLTTDSKPSTSPPHLSVPPTEEAHPSPKLPTPQTLQKWLPLYLQKTDRSLETLSEIISTKSGTDTLLMTICYTTLLTSSLLSSLSLHTIRTQMRHVLKIAGRLPPNTTVLVDISSIPPSPLLIGAARLKALSALISDVRIFGRIFGLLGIYRWGKSVVRDEEEQDVVVRRIAGVQVVCNVVFQALENGAYLSSKGVLGWSVQRQNQAWLWACRFWMAHVVLDFGRLWRERHIRVEKRTEGGEKGEFDGWERGWWREVVVNSSWFPLTLHWGLEGGLLNDFGVGVLGSICGISGLQVLIGNLK